MARRHGASEALVEALQDRGGGGPIEALAEGWRTALTYAETLHGSGHEVTDALYARLAGAWDPGQIVEISLVAGMAEYFNRFNNALRVEPTK